jgi:hypothetical protein
MTQVIENKVKSRIYGHGRGWCFTQKDFTDLGSVEAIKISFFRLEKSDFIRRLSHGLYDYPLTHKKLGLLWPNVEAVVMALARKYQLKVQPSGAYAANLLGLSDQVPGKVIYLIDGNSKELTIGNMNIVLKKTTSKNMKTAGKISGLVIQALKYLGEDFVTDKTIKTIKRKLSDSDKKRLSLDANLASGWISKIIKKEILGDWNG